MGQGDLKISILSTAHSDSIYSARAPFTDRIPTTNETYLFTNEDEPKVEEDDNDRTENLLNSEEDISLQ